MIDVENNLFDEKYLTYLLSGIKNVNIENPYYSKKYTNYYYRYELEIEDKVKSNLQSFLYKKYGKKYLLKDNGFWINEVTSESNKNDMFHNDNSDITIVTYLNENFIGGEFEYLDNNLNSIKILPKIGLSLIMDSELQHRVVAVDQGIRYSLVCFFELIPKSKKTLI